MTEQATRNGETHVGGYSDSDLVVFEAVTELIPEMRVVRVEPFSVGRDGHVGTDDNAVVLSADQTATTITLPVGVTLEEFLAVAGSMRNNLSQPVSRGDVAMLRTMKGAYQTALRLEEERRERRTAAVTTSPRGRRHVAA